MNAWQAIGATVLLLVVIFVAMAAVTMVNVGFQRLADRLMDPERNEARSKASARVVKAEALPASPPELES